MSLRLHLEKADLENAGKLDGRSQVPTDGRAGHELEGLAAERPRAHGRQNDPWGDRRVAEVIHRHFGVEYHAEHARKVIRGRLRWSSQRPQLKAKPRNEAKNRPLRSWELPQIIERAEGREVHLVFFDEPRFQLSPVVRRTFAPRGKTPIQQAWHRKPRVSAISAVTVTRYGGGPTSTSACWLITPTPRAKTRSPS